MPGFYVHAREPEAPEGSTCDRCERGIGGTVAYWVSHDGVAPKYRLCAPCKRDAEVAYGREPAPEQPARKKARGGR